MTPGPTVVCQCPACSKPLFYNTTRSGNTFGATYSTDGKIDAPMLPDRPRVQKCHHCGALFWIEEQNRIGEIAPGELGTVGMNTYPDACLADTPAFADYVRLLQAGVRDKQKERYLRIRIWWAGNDSRRKPGRSKSLDRVETENLTALVLLLDELDDNERILKAEALRELGRFAAAEDLLATDFSPHLAPFVEAIRAHICKRSTGVRKVLFGRML